MHSSPKMQKDDKKLTKFAFASSPVGVCTFTGANAVRFWASRGPPLPPVLVNIGPQNVSLRRAAMAASIASTGARGSLRDEGSALYHSAHNLQNTQQLPTPSLHCFSRSKKGGKRLVMHQYNGFFNRCLIEKNTYFFRH